MCVECVIKYVLNMRPKMFFLVLEKTQLLSSTSQMGALPYSSEMEACIHFWRATRLPPPRTSPKSSRLCEVNTPAIGVLVSFQPNSIGWN